MASPNAPTPGRTIHAERWSSSASEVTVVRRAIAAPASRKHVDADQLDNRARQAHVVPATGAPPIDRRKQDLTRAKFDGGPRPLHRIHTRRFPSIVGKRLVGSRADLDRFDGDNDCR